MRRAFAWWGLVVLACEPISSAPPPIAPYNTCPAHPCSAYAPYQTGIVPAQCDPTRGACLVPANLAYTLVVALPETSFFAPGRSIAVSSTSLFSGADAICPRLADPANGLPFPCARLPDIGNVTGIYVVEAAQTDTTLGVGFNLGNGSNQTVLPVDVTYRPLWPAPTDGTLTDPVSIGLPLLPTLAQYIVGPYVLPGPDNSPAMQFQAALPQGTYERTVAPQAPFDTAFPPDVATVTVTSGTTDQPDLMNLDTTSPSGGRGQFPMFNICREDGQLMDGATVFLRDQTTLRTVSSVTTLGSANVGTASPGTLCTNPAVTYTVHLFTNHHPPAPANDALDNTELVVVPSAAAQPTMVIPRLGLDSLEQQYPAIPAPVQVSGTVTSTDGTTPLSAGVTLTSTKIFTADSKMFSTNLVYGASFQSGQDGSFSVSLPPGDYSVIVTPDAVGFAKTLISAPLEVNATFPQQAGKSLAVEQKRVVTGSAQVSDGRPLAGAEVDALAAAGQLATTPAAALPRQATTVTDANGNFTLLLDGGQYDIVVRPANGSRLPWVVSPSRQVGETGVVLSALSVPAPIDASLVLMDPASNRIPYALVRAFAQAGTAYVEIGRAYTDQNGAFEMYLAGAPQ